MEQTHVAVRRSRAADLEAFEAFVAGLSTETSTRRFFAPTTRLPRGNARILLTNDRRRGAFLATHGDRVVAHGCWAAVGPDAAEIALVVGDAAQRRGLGKMLTRALMRDMLDAGIRRMEMVVEPDNRAVVGLIARGWPDARPRSEDGLLTFSTPTAEVSAGQRAVA
jgi:ribosomal protein S18 acetylase RimI-like enzyme